MCFKKKKATYVVCMRVCIIGARAVRRRHRVPRALFVIWPFHTTFLSLQLSLSSLTGFFVAFSYLYVSIIITARGIPNVSPTASSLLLPHFSISYSSDLRCFYYYFFSPILSIQSPFHLSANFSSICGWEVFFFIFSSLENRITSFFLLTRTNNSM